MLWPKLPPLPLHFCARSWNVHGVRYYDVLRYDSFLQSRKIKSDQHGWVFFPCHDTFLNIGLESLPKKT